MLRTAGREVAKAALRRLGLLEAAKRVLRPVAEPPPVATDDAYAARIAAEKKTFVECTNVHDLPEIFHYWSNKYLGPLFASCGFSHPDSFFALHLEKSFKKGKGRKYVVSIGAGNCDTEVRVARELVNRGHTDFVIECMDLNPDMLARGKKLAEESGVAGQIALVEADFNRWRPSREYNAVLANQSLHHMLELETVFDAVKKAIGKRGVFITSDMIGRNGHQRWPEALAVVQEFWRELPEGYRYNQMLKRHENEFMDWDCSTEGFEGIRAQDILPLLVDNFQFDFFAGFGNVIDPFIDRGFGHNFNAKATWDRDFIDRVQARDDAEMRAGTVKPTHMMAVMRNEASVEPFFANGLSPRFCVRDPKAHAPAPSSVPSVKTETPARDLQVDGVTIRIPAIMETVGRDDLVSLYWRFHPRFQFLKTMPRDAVVADVGAGPGGLAVWLEWNEPIRRDVGMYAFDLARGEHFGRYRGFQLGDLEKDGLKHADGFFDVVIASHFLEHIRDEHKLLSEFRRVLKPGGLAYIEIPTPATLDLPRRDRFIASGLRVSTTNFFDDHTHLRTFSPDELQKLVTKHGFETVEAGVIRNPYVEDRLLAYGLKHQDEEVATYGLWSKLEWAHYVIVRAK